MEEQQRQFKGIWIPKEIWINKELTQQEKMILVEIDSYDDGKIGCYASNKHFVNNFGINSSRVSQIIQSLQRKGWIDIEYEYKGKEIIKRYLHINKPPYPLEIGMLKNEMGVCQFHKGGYVKKLKDNNTYTNNTNNNNIIYSQVLPYEEIINYLNLKANTHYRHTIEKTKSLINARFNENFTLDDFKKVIDNKVSEWKDTEMEKYLRPETLFGTKFESYLNQKKKETLEEMMERITKKNEQRTSN